MVDEAHHFKNLAIFSKMNNVSGISSSGSQKATDMQLKCQYLTELNGGRGIVCDRYSRLKYHVRAVCYAVISSEGSLALFISFVQ